MIIVKNRKMVVPYDDMYIGTTYDDDSERRIFRIDRYAQNERDLSALTFRLDIKQPGQPADTVILDKDIDERYIYLIWNITNSVIRAVGLMFVQIRAIDSEATVKWSTYDAALYVARHLNTPGSYTGSLTEIEQMEQDFEYMKGVVEELKANLDYAHDAEAWAKGTRSGSAVPSTDSTYHNNSKYYSEQANAKATAAANSATAAAGSATQAAATVADTNARFNNAVAAVTVNTEVQDARVGADGTTYTVLKDRLDAEHTQVKSHLGVFIYSTTTNGYWGHIAIASAMSVGDILLVRPITATDVDYVQLHGTNANNADVNIAELTVGEWSGVTLTQNYTNVKVLYHLTSIHVGDTYQAACFFTDNGDSLANALTHVYDYAKGIGAEADGLYISSQTPFVDPVPVGMRGIIGFKIIKSPDATPLSSSTDYRVSSFYYKSSGFYFYLQVQRKVADTWRALDGVLILTADAPTETANMIFTATNGSFQVAVNTTLLSVGSYGGVNARIKPPATQPFLTDMQNQVNVLTSELQYGDYEDQDTIKHVIHVDPSGNGDYTTIAAAYAAITDSSFVNQYEVILEPGTYEEYNLICPAYTHTHGYNWKTTIVTSENVSGSTLPVFDQKYYPSKLSNMTIISGTGYCIHNDYNFINTGAVYNENLYCKKVYGVAVPDFSWISKGNPSIIGAGAQYGGAKIIYNNCTFEDGAVVCHSNSAATEEGNFHFVLKNCKVVNAYVQLNMAGISGAATKGLWICELDGLTAPVGCPALTTKVGARLNDATWFGWQIIGGNNKNFAVRLDNASDTLTTDVPWDHVNTNEKIFCQAVTAVTKGQWMTDSLAVASANENHHNIMGVALADAAVGDTFPVWIGDAYMYTGTDGEYGIGSSGALSASATEKIGKIRNNIFYRY